METIHRSTDGLPTQDPHGGRSGRDHSLSESENAALGSLSGVLSRLRPLTEFDGLLRDTIAVLESGEAQLREAAYALRHYADPIERDPKRLHEVEQTLSARIRTSKRSPGSASRARTARVMHRLARPRGGARIELDASAYVSAHKRLRATVLPDRARNVIGAPIHRIRERAQP